MITIPHKQIKRDELAHKKIRSIKFIKDFVLPIGLFTDRKFKLNLTTQNN